MARKKVEFKEYGAGAHELEMPDYALADENDYPEKAVARAIARKNGLHVLTTCGAGYDPEAKKQHYRVTLGKPGYFGGYDIVAQFWITIASDHLV